MAHRHPGACGGVLRGRGRCQSAQSKHHVLPGRVVHGGRSSAAWWKSGKRQRPGGGGRGRKPFKSAPAPMGWPAAAHPCARMPLQGDSKPSTHTRAISPQQNLLRLTESPRAPAQFGFPGQGGGASGSPTSTSEVAPHPLPARLHPRHQSHALVWLLPAAGTDQDARGVEGRDHEGYDGPSQDA